MPEDAGRVIEAQMAYVRATDEGGIGEDAEYPECVGGLRDASA